MIIPGRKHPELYGLFCKTLSKIDQNIFGKTVLGTGLLTMLSLDEKIFLILFLHEALISPSEMLKTLKKIYLPASSITKWH